MSPIGLNCSDGMYLYASTLATLVNDLIDLCVELLCLEFDCILRLLFIAIRGTTEEYASFEPLSYV